MTRGAKESRPRCATVCGIPGSRSSSKGIWWVAHPVTLHMKFEVDETTRYLILLISVCHSLAVTTSEQAEPLELVRHHHLAKTPNDTMQKLLGSSVDLKLMKYPFQSCGDQSGHSC